MESIRSVASKAVARATRIESLEALVSDESNPFPGPRTVNIRASYRMYYGYGRTAYGLYTATVDLRLEQCNDLHPIQNLSNPLGLEVSQHIFIIVTLHARCIRFFCSLSHGERISTLSFKSVHSFTEDDGDIV